jgi:hypothetical protein
VVIDGVGVVGLEGRAGVGGCGAEGEQCQAERDGWGSCGVRSLGHWGLLPAIFADSAQRLRHSEDTGEWDNCTREAQEFIWMQ